MLIIWEAIDYEFIVDCFFFFFWKTTTIISVTTTITSFIILISFIISVVVIIISIVSVVLLLHFQLEQVNVDQLVRTESSRSADLVDGSHGLSRRRFGLRRRFSVADYMDDWGAEMPFDSLSDYMMERTMPVSYEPSPDHIRSWYCFTVVQYPMPLTTFQSVVGHLLVWTVLPSPSVLWCEHVVITWLIMSIWLAVQEIAEVNKRLERAFHLEGDDDQADVG